LDDTTFYEAVSEAEAILLNPNATHADLEYAKDLSEAINLLDQDEPACVGD